MAERDRLRTAFRLHEAGLDLMGQNLRRRFPEASEQEIRRKLAAWLGERSPDSPGRLVPWPRPRE